MAFCISATTPDISLKGFVYWLAYERKQLSCPMDIPPDMAESAPVSPTPAYTRLFTNRTEGFVMLEKNTPLTVASVYSLFIFSNCSISAFSYPKSCTSFIPSILSLTSAVCLPPISFLSLKNPKVFLDMNAATSRLTGVMSTTTRAMRIFVTSMNMSVPSIVSIPEKNWVNPSRSPSENCSTSDMILLTISPERCESR